MKRKMLRDLARWEIGEISLEDLAASHPRSDVRSVAATLAAMRAISDEPVPDASTSWRSLASRLTAEKRNRRGFAARMKKPIIAIVAAALLAIGMAAYASTAVKKGAAEVGRRLNDLVDVIVPNRPPAEPESPAPPPNPAVEPEFDELRETPDADEDDEDDEDDGDHLVDDEEEDDDEEDS